MEKRQWWVRARIATAVKGGNNDEEYRRWQRRNMFRSLEVKGRVEREKESWGIFFISLSPKNSLVKRFRERRDSWRGDLKKTTTP